MYKKPHFFGLEKDYSFGYFKYAWIILVVVQRDYLIVPRRLYKGLCWQLYTILSCKSGFISTTTTVYMRQKFHVPFFPLGPSLLHSSLSNGFSFFPPRFLVSRPAWLARTVQGSSCLSFPSSPPSALHSTGNWSRCRHTGKVLWVKTFLEDSENVLYSNECVNLVTTGHCWYCSQPIIFSSPFKMKISTVHTLEGAVQVWHNYLKLGPIRNCDINILDANIWKKKCIWKKKMYFS